MPQDFILSETRNSGRLLTSTEAAMLVGKTREEVEGHTRLKKFFLGTEKVCFIWESRLKATFPKTYKSNRV